MCGVSQLCSQELRIVQLVAFRRTERHQKILIQSSVISRPSQEMVLAYIQYVPGSNFAWLACWLS